MSVPIDVVVLFHLYIPDEVMERVFHREGDCHGEDELSVGRNMLRVGEYAEQKVLACFTFPCIRALVTARSLVLGLDDCHFFAFFIGILAKVVVC